MQHTEAEIRREVLTELATSKNGTLTISELIDLLETRLAPVGHDAEIIDNRSDTFFSQKVRNTVSHRNNGTGLQACGLAEYDGKSESWTITDHGRALIHTET
jgi:hypothetical protein